MTMIRGTHSLKAGFDYRTLAGNIIIQPPLSVAATSNFNGGPNPAAALAASGSGIAELLLGAASVTATIVPFEQVRRLIQSAPPEEIKSIMTVSTASSSQRTHLPIKSSYAAWSTAVSPFSTFTLQAKTAPAYSQLY